MKIAAILALLAAAAHADLKWENSSQKFTYEPGKAVFKTEFAFTNNGKSPVRITSVKSGCTCCTSAKAKKMIFAAGERGAIAVKVDVRGKQVPITRPVLIGTDDGKFSTILVEISTKDGQTVMVPKWGK